MAAFVGAFGVPHIPMFADMVKREGASSETGALFARVREALERDRLGPMALLKPAPCRRQRAARRL